MLDNDELTYSYQKRPGPAKNSRLAERALITVDRSQKLDLLIHLLTNLQQSLVVCGPEGIGKTTLLKTFESGHKDIWPICFVQGSSALSFESVVSHLSRFLNLSNSSVSFDLTALRAFCSKQKVVLIIDDAGELVSGLLGELMDFADSLSGLRLVFAMNNDALQAKTTAESAINDCHFIEVPPLNQRQCLEYLQNLSAQPGSQISFAAVTDALVEAMYRKTLGVPGKILAEFPKLKSSQGSQSLKWGLWLGVAGIVAASGLAVRAFLPADLLEPAAVDRVAEPAVQTVNQIPVTTPPAEPVEQTLPVASNVAPVTDALPEPELSQPAATTQPETIQIPKAPEEAAIEVIPATPVAAKSQVQTKQDHQSEPTDQAASSITAQAIKGLNPPSPKPAEKITLPRPAGINQPLVLPPQAPLVAKVEPVTPPAAVLAPVVAPIAKPAIETQAAASNEPAVQMPATVVADTPAENNSADLKAVEAKIVEKPTPAKPLNVKPDHAATTDSSDHEWIMAQPGDNYTVQVMVLSSKDSVTRFMRKYAEFRSDLKSYPIGKEGQEKYAIIYGSFATPVEALNQKSDMPPEFTNGLVKRMKQVQRENRRN